ncbi:MAG: PCC domain-containing protein [Brevibacterium sp.]
MSEVRGPSTATSTRIPDYPLGRPGEPVIHAGPRQSPRIVSVPSDNTVHEIELAEGRDLFEALTGCLDSSGTQGLMVEFRSGEFGRITYVHPAFGPDAAHPMSFTDHIDVAGPNRLRRASATVGMKDGAPFAHIHASWTEAGGQVRGGHLLPGTLVGPAGLNLRVNALADARLLSQVDPETGFSAFAPEPAQSTPAQAVDSPDAVVSRVRPGEILDEAVIAICRTAGFASAEVSASLGSTTGAVFVDGTAPWPAVEFTHLSGAVTGANGDDPQLRLEAEVVDVDGVVHSGELAPGANPVAVTFELFVRRLG